MTLLEHDDPEGPRGPGFSIRRVMSRRRFLLLAGASVGGVIQACSGSPGPPSPSRVQVSPTVGFPTSPPTGRPIFGAFINRWVEGVDFEGMNVLVGGALRARRFYFAMDDAADGRFDVSTAVNHGVRPVISVISATRAGRGLPWGDVAAGRHDDLLFPLARALSAIPIEFDFAFHHEPNDDRSGHRLSVGRPSDFVAANRHVRAYLSDHAVEHMKFGVIFNKHSGTYATSAAFSSWYPGAEHVDWLGFDGYSHAFQPGQRIPEVQPLTFADIVSPAVATARDMGKPLKVTETNCWPNPADPLWKPDWYRGIPETVSANPVIHMVLMFTGDGPPWRVDDTPQVFDAFSDVANDPVFSG